MHKRQALLAAPLALLTAACAAPTGDFGRPRPSVINDRILPAIGTASAYARGEPVSLAPHTDEERMLRDQAYAIIMPPLERQIWEKGLAELQRTRIFGEYFPPFDPNGYANSLLSTPYRSSTARYNQLIQDVTGDAALVGPFFATADRVAQMDAIRADGLRHLTHLPLQEREMAAARIAENAMLIEWVQRRFGDRFLGYKLALDRLVLATPAPAAVEAERSLHLLERRLAEATDMSPIAAADAPARSVGIVKK